MAPEKELKVWVKDDEDDDNDKINRQDVYMLTRIPFYPKIL